LPAFSACFVEFVIFHLFSKLLLPPFPFQQQRGSLRASPPTRNELLDGPRADPQAPSRTPTVPPSCNDTQKLLAIPLFFIHTVGRFQTFLHLYDPVVYPPMFTDRFSEKVPLRSPPERRERATSRSPFLPNLVCFLVCFLFFLFRCSHALIWSLSPPFSFSN